ncbi:MAG: hypothetical protein EOM20_03165 [Spartobacteria bacterium]|nr:hypothetical protein [Spartobacteria bacterium]
MNKVCVKNIMLVLWCIGCWCGCQVQTMEDAPAPDPNADVVYTPTPTPQVSRTPRLRPTPRQPRTKSILRADGIKIVDAQGEQQFLQGCNLGNWLLLEMWMLDMEELQDQHEFEAILEERFGPEEKDRLMALYRENWITDRDFDLIRSFRFNVVRLPFNYTLLEDPERPGEVKPEAFKWLDLAVEKAGKRGMYVILDMHGVPGGQSIDHTTGHKGQNRLYHDEKYWARTASLWKHIATHFKDSPVVAGYDLINEPFGDMQTRDHHEPLVKIIDLIYREVRSVDTEHIVFIPATMDGFSFYGAPSEHGWENVAFTQHFYPGLFGEEPSREAHGRFISREIPITAHQLEQLNVPFLVGEFNVVFQFIGGAALMRVYYDIYRNYGWAATMWSYKLIKKAGGMEEDTWCMVKNQENRPDISIRESSLQEIESFFRWLGSMEYAVHGNLGAALNAKSPPPVTILDYPAPYMEPPAVDDMPGWTAVDIHNALPGGQRMITDECMEIYGGGEDIYEASDQFRFVYKEVRGNFSFGAAVAELDETHQYAKAAIMLRAGLAHDDPFVMINVFPGGNVLVVQRNEKGGLAEQEEVGVSLFPARLRMMRKGNLFALGFFTTADEWATRRLTLPAVFNGTCYVGMAVLSHDNRILTRALFDHISFNQVK